MKDGVANLSASVHARLLNKARAENRPFQELLLYYAMERFLHRLACSAHADAFVLKGATHMLQWEDPSGIAAGLIAFLARHPIA